MKIGAGSLAERERQTGRSFCGLHLQPVAHAGARLGRVLGMGLGTFLQLGDVLLTAAALGPIRLDGLFAVRRELRLPVALALLLLREEVLLVLLRIPPVVRVCVRVEDQRLAGHVHQRICLCRDEQQGIEENGYEDQKPRGFGRD